VAPWYTRSEPYVDPAPVFVDATGTPRPQRVPLSLANIRLFDCASVKNAARYAAAHNYPQAYGAATSPRGAQPSAYGASALPNRVV
jgi:hypothetical protein